MSARWSFISCEVRHPPPRSRRRNGSPRFTKRPIIVHPNEIEAVRGRHRTAAAAVGRLERRLERLRAPAPRPDLDQRSHHRAHLAMQERARARFEHDLVAVAPDVEPVEGADRRFRLALQIAEGREIVSVRSGRGRPRASPLESSRGLTRQACPRSSVSGEPAIDVR